MTVTSTGIIIHRRPQWGKFDRKAAAEDNGPPARPATSKHFRKGWKHPKNDK